jgi:hypothetical protein
VSLFNFFHQRSLSVILQPGHISCVVRHGRSEEARFSIDAQDWRSALALLATHLQGQDAASGRGGISVRLCARWSRPMMIPWDDALLAQQTAEVYLHQHFHALFGSVAAHWSFALDDAAYGQPRLCCAIERGLLDALHTFAADQGGKVLSIQPMFIETMQVAPSVRAGSDRLVAVIETRDLTFCWLRAGRIVALEVERWHGGADEELEHTYLRWTLRQPDLPAAADIEVIDISGAASAPALPHRFRRLEVPGRTIPDMNRVA